MDYATELEQLRTNLEQTREKVLHRWLDTETHNVEQDIVHKENKKIQNAEALHEHAVKVKSLQSELSQVKKEAAQKLQQKENIDEELCSARENLDREKELLSAQEKAVSEKLSELEKAASMFRERLGLRFKKTSGSRLQVIFNCIDDKDPDANFFFYVQINNGKYIVSGCEPVVDNFGNLTEKLNSTNNFRSFVIAMRKAFKATLKS